MTELYVQRLPGDGSPTLQVAEVASWNSLCTNACHLSPSRYTAHSHSQFSYDSGVRLSAETSAGWSHTRLSELKSLPRLT